MGTLVPVTVVIGVAIRRFDRPEICFRMDGNAPPRVEFQDGTPTLMWRTTSWRAARPVECKGQTDKGVDDEELSNRVAGL